MGRLAILNLPLVCLVLGAIALGRALQINNGFYNLEALRWLTGALILTLLATFAARLPERISRVSQTVVTVLLVAGIAWQIQQLYATPPGFHVSDRASMPLFYTLLAAQGLCLMAGVSRIRALQNLWFPAVLAVSLGLGVWMIRASPEPLIDVVVVHKEALDALLSDRDPYRISFANVYERDQAAVFYNPEAMIGGRLAIGYPYPPASLLLAVPGYLLTGDYRYSELLLLVAAAALIGYARRSLIAALAACLLLTTPRVWFVIEQGWTEPIAIFTLALTVFLVNRSAIAAGWAAGLMAVTKQYLGFAGLAVLRLLWREPRRWIWVGLGIALSAAIVTLPLALWHPNAFMRNVVWLQTLEPFRMDSLSYLSWAAHNGIGRGSFVWAVGAATLGAVVTQFTTRNTANGLAISVAATTFLMFAFGSKAFCNYYFFVIGALCAAIASYGAEPSQRTAS